MSIELTHLLLSSWCDGWSLEVSISNGSLALSVAVPIQPVVLALVTFGLSGAVCVSYLRQPSAAEEEIVEQSSKLLLYRTKTGSVLHAGRCRSLKGAGVNLASCEVFEVCHWCAKDSACHAKGSVSGCVWGATCPAP